jgi:hypothetical protein
LTHQFSLEISQCSFQRIFRETRKGVTVDKLAKNGGKVLAAGLIGLIVRVLMLQLLPLSPTFELPLSRISQAIGMIPTAASVVTVMYLAIAVIWVYVQDEVVGSRLMKAAVCALASGGIWFVGVLESVPALGKPLAPELVVGLADIIPIIVMSIVLNVWPSSDVPVQRSQPSRQNLLSFTLIASMCVVGRYFLYAVVHVNSGYVAYPEATFVWTLALGAAVGGMYVLLQDGVKGESPWQRSLWFGLVAFGIFWGLFSFFMPIVFDMSFIDFQPSTLNYVWRAVIDLLAVTIGVWLAEQGKAALTNLNPG